MPQGAASKWADKWGERDQREGGGQYRKWGDKWTQQFQNGTGHRWCVALTSRTPCPTQTCTTVAQLLPLLYEKSVQTSSH